MGIDTKYRPKTFDDVIGQDIATTILKTSVIRNKFDSSYLFKGPSGVGKTTLARVFSKAILCQAPVDGNPCGLCESCLSFDSEQNYNYMELDAASVGGKEDMVKLKDEASFISSGKKKIICIDECHDISKQGQDALLKQMEQCPEHLIYLFCTTEAEKLRPTLKKRCTQFQFSRVSADLILKRLKIICDLEKLSYEEPALLIIADKSEGHVRDALKLLQEVEYFGSITVENVSKLTVDFSSKICDVLLNIGSNLPLALEISKDLTSYISVWEFYEQLMGMVCDAVKVIYGYEDFSEKRKALLIKLRDIHGCNLIEFMNYLLTREKFIDRIGLNSDLILLHYKFCTDSFKPQISEQKIIPQEQIKVSEEQKPIVEQVPPPASLSVKHDQLMSLPIAKRAALLQQQGSCKISGKEDTQKVPNEWSLPKEERQGSDSSISFHKELSPLEFSRLLVGGRGGGLL